MNFESKIFKLKSGSDVKLRIATVSEAQKLLDLKRSYIKNTTSIPLTLDEYPNDLEHEKATVSWARQKSEIELLWLDVYASNKLGTNLYKNTGFRVSGVIEDFFKVEDGYADKIQMYQRV